MSLTQEELATLIEQENTANSPFEKEAKEWLAFIKNIAQQNLSIQPQLETSQMQQNPITISKKLLAQPPSFHPLIRSSVVTPNLESIICLLQRFSAWRRCYHLTSTNSPSLDDIAGLIKLTNDIASFYEAIQKDLKQQESMLKRKLESLRNKIYSQELERLEQDTERQLEQDTEQQLGEIDNIKDKLDGLQSIYQYPINQTLLEIYSSLNQQTQQEAQELSQQLAHCIFKPKQASHRVFFTWITKGLYVNSVHCQEQAADSITQCYHAARNNFINSDQAALTTEPPSQKASINPNTLARSMQSFFLLNAANQSQRSRETWCNPTNNISHLKRLSLDQ